MSTADLVMRVAVVGSLLAIGCARREFVTAPSSALTNPTGSTCADMNARLEDLLDADYDAGQYDAALKHATAALETCEGDAQATLLDRERVRARHARSLISAGEVEQAEAEAQRAYDVLERNVGIDSIDTALALEELVS